MDPIAEMLCRFWDLEMKEEERVRDSWQDVADPITSSPSTSPSSSQQTTSQPTPGGTTFGADSKCDYVVYTIRSGNRVIAMLIEAKTTMHNLFQHSPAQVLGYAIKYTTEEGRPPLVLERSVKFLHFPFKDISSHYMFITH